MRSPLLAALALGLAAPVQAQTWNCNDPDNLPQQGMNYCAHQDFKAADAKLNAVYKRARARLREADSYAPDNMIGGADALLEAQRAWIAFRDKACRAEGWLFRGGTMEPLIVSTCLTKQTERRIKDLELLAENM